MRILFSPIWAAALVAGIGMSTASVLQAQGVNPEEITAVNPEDVTEGQLVSFVNAFVALERMRAQFVERIEAAETQEEREALVQQADEAAIKVVDDMTGITPDEYISIVKALPESEELRTRVSKRIEEIRKPIEPKGFSN
jgi:predicted ABC-class ATPase